MSKNLNIIIAGGKTGGHLFPGIAIANALERIVETTDYNIKILFVGTDAEFEIKILEQYQYAHKAIFSKPIKGGNIISKVFSLSIIMVSLIQSMFIIKRFKADFVLGVGGFSSFAVILAAWIYRTPNAIQEQNALPGMTNRILSKFTKTIFTSFKDTKGFINNPKVKYPKIKYFGNPVRKIKANKIKANKIKKSDTPDTKESFDLKNYDSDKFTILVTGGSQGASSINSAFMDALELLKNDDNCDLKQFNIFHQTGINDEALIKERYKNIDIDKNLSININATAKAFFHDMPRLQQIADLVITRAGAGIISELCVKGLPAIFIPFPYAADDHQTFNAKAIEKQGGAVVIDDKYLTGEVLRQNIKALIKDRKKLKKMGKIMKSLAMPKADENIASYILKILEAKV